MTKLRFPVFFTFTLIFSIVAGQAESRLLAGSEWGLGEGDERYVQFASGGKVSGHAGCNRFFTSYEQQGSKMQIAGIATTRMFCGEVTMKREKEWLDLLNRVRSFKMTHLKLTLYGAKRVQLAVLKRRDFD